MSKRFYFTILILLFVAACGGGNNATFEYDASIVTQAPPYIHRIDPLEGKIGDTVTVYGFGFSAEFPSNVVSIGGASTVCTGYTLLVTPSDGEIESLTFTVPASAKAGEALVFVDVFNNISNSDKKFTVVE